MNIKTKPHYLTSIVAVLIILLSGCYPNGPEYNSDYALVVTDYDSEYNFGAQKTYYMPDEINLETNIENIDKERIEEFEELVLDLIATNMNQRNYTRIDTAGAQKPDMVIGVSALAIENTGVGWVPGPCWSWWCWYYPTWYPYGYSYSTGTVIIQMGVPDGVIDFVDDEAGLVWIGALDGLLSSSVNNNQAGVTNGINQAFEQSPYIQSNQ